MKSARKKIGPIIMRNLTAVVVLNLILASFVAGQVPTLPKTQSKEGAEPLRAEKIPTGSHELTAQDLSAVDLVFIVSMIGLVLYG